VPLLTTNSNCGQMNMASQGKDPPGRIDAEPAHGSAQTRNCPPLKFALMSSMTSGRKTGQAYDLS
jgi:hypothetical protein